MAYDPENEGCDVCGKENNLARYAFNFVAAKDEDILQLAYVAKYASDEPPPNLFGPVLTCVCPEHDQNSMLRAGIVPREVWDAFPGLSDCWEQWKGAHA